MAEQKTTESEGRKPLTPAQRRMLQQSFEAANKQGSLGQFDYATALYTNCLKLDPGNPLYVQNFIGNLQRMYNNNKKGATMAGTRTAMMRTSLQKTIMQSKWEQVLGEGIEILKLNPWETGTLSSMANACKQLDMTDAQIVYLKSALDANLKDAEINRQLGEALGDQARFDEAIACWNRVLAGKPGDPDAQRAIHKLTVRKTIEKGKYEEAETTQDMRVDKDAAPGRAQLTAEQQLEKAIAKDPSNVGNYIELAAICQKEDRFDKAEAVLAKALEASGGDVQVREQLEDVQLRHARQKVEVAEKKAQEERTQEAVELVRRMKTELNNQEIVVYTSRCDRYPQNLGFKFELAVRLQRGKKFPEAIKLFQQAQSDPKRKGQVLLQLGECFQQIRQFKLAQSNYDLAVQNIAERDEDLRKLAHYRAGRLALELKDYDTAEKFLTVLAGLDFGYRDVADLLDKLSKLRDDGASSLDE